ncbi:hypothetical protein [Bacteroides acidifaciens]|uniref:hypothetical protein n=1 Tax=Bacteroides acidifaciens TaxID=85831 RepID=UPI003F68F186
MAAYEKGSFGSRKTSEKHGCWQTRYPSQASLRTAGTPFRRYIRAKKTPGTTVTFDKSAPAYSPNNTVLTENDDDNHKADGTRTGSSTISGSTPHRTSNLQEKAKLAPLMP